RRDREGAVAVAMEDADGVLGAVHDHQVDVAVAIEVGGGEIVGGAAGGDGLRWLEGAVAVAEQETDAVGARIVGDRDVREAVAVEVGDRGPRWTRTGGVGLRRLEGSVAVAEQNVDALAGDGDDIERVAGVEFGESDRRRVRADGVTGGRGERAVTKASV